jgi:pyrimidine operon attenuation protein/uracil phosphoribosyltransferase
VLNVSFHRDDIGSRPITAPKSPTNFPFEIDRANIVLIDDVIHSGRTTRAAMDELFEHGRPALVKLITLVDRGSRSLPIQPDFSAIALELQSDQKLSVLIDPKDSQRNQILIR